MAASVSDIIELVCVNSTSSTRPIHQAPASPTQKPAEASKATAAL